MSCRPPVVAYIAGYGRSGSTWLDILLGAHPEVLSLGEAGRLWELAETPTALCVCGEPYPRCRQWQPVLQSVGNVREEAAGIESWLRGAWRRGRAAGDHGARYAESTARCFELVAADGRARVLVDSTNTAYHFFWRPAALRRAAGLDVRLIHLVRDPRAVIASGLRGQNTRLAVGDETKRPMSAGITLVGWIAANLAARANARLVDGAMPRGRRSLVLLYEDLIVDPERALDRIGRLLQLDMEPVRRRLELGEPFEPGHLVAGNRMARGGPVRPRSAPFDAPQLGLLSRAGCAVLARPLHALLRRAATTDPDEEP